EVDQDVLQLRVRVRRLALDVQGLHVEHAVTDRQRQQVAVDDVGADPGLRDRRPYRVVVRHLLVRLAGSEDLGIVRQLEDLQLRLAVDVAPGDQRYQVLPAAWRHGGGQLERG